LHDASFEKRRSENVCNNLARGCLEMTVSVQDSGIRSKNFRAQVGLL